MSISFKLLELKLHGDFLRFIFDYESEPSNWRPESYFRGLKLWNDVREAESLYQRRAIRLSDFRKVVDSYKAFLLSKDW